MAIEFSTWLYAIAVVGGSFLAGLAIDALLVGWRMAPRWWLRLRLPMSLCLATCCALSGWVLGR